MPLINCDINLILTLSANSFIIEAPLENQVSAFTKTDTKLYVSVINLSTLDNAELLQQLKSVLKEKLTGININQK